MPPRMIGPFLVWLAGVGVILFFGARVVFGVWPWERR